MAHRCPTRTHGRLRGIPRLGELPRLRLSPDPCSPRIDLGLHVGPPSRIAGLRRLKRGKRGAPVEVAKGDLPGVVPPCLATPAVEPASRRTQPCIGCPSQPSALPHPHDRSSRPGTRILEGPAPVDWPETGRARDPAGALTLSRLARHNGPQGTQASRAWDRRTRVGDSLSRRLLPRPTRPPVCVAREKAVAGPPALPGVLSLACGGL